MTPKAQIAKEKVGKMNFTNIKNRDFLADPVVKNLPASAGNMGLILIHH